MQTGLKMHPKSQIMALGVFCFGVVNIVLPVDQACLIHSTRPHTIQSHV